MSPLPVIAAAIAEGIAANLVTGLLNASAGKVRRGFSNRTARAALDAAVAEALLSALTAALHTTSGGAMLRDHYEGLFRSFFAREPVAEELAQLLDPRPGASPNPEVLAHELEACGFAAELLVDFDLPAFVASFAQGFYSAAGRQPALHCRIELRLLGDMVAGLGVVAGHQERTEAAVQHVAEGVGELVALVRGVLAGNLPEQRLLGAAQEIEGRGFLPAFSAQEGLARELLREGLDLTFGADGAIDLRESGAGTQALTTAQRAAILTVLRGLRSVVLAHAPDEDELRELEKRYRAHLVHWFENLTFQGLMHSARPIVLALEEVYVELRAVAEVPDEADAFSAEERRLLLDLDDGAPEARRELMRQFDALRRDRWSRSLPQRKPIAEALYDHDCAALVILGDPGSGKSTLLHFLTLIHARGAAAVTSRLVVPPAEADRLPIFVPLAAFDDMRRETKGLTLLDFLPRYYDRRRGLPGLSSLFRRALEAGRALVLLDGLDEVLDSASRANVAEQVGALIGELAPRGVRFALTSRIVGYREAPVPGKLPTWTVLDFGPPEIEFFAHHWALAYERWLSRSESSEVLLRAHRLASDLLEDVRSSESVGRLAANPLMLTMLALLRRQVGRLPHRRVLLYESYLGTLLENWIDARSQGAREGSRNALDRLQAENVLIPLALWLHVNRPSGTARRAEFQRCVEDVRLAEAGVSRDSATQPQLRLAEREADQFLRELRQMTGLLVERGLDAFGFLHPTFQEYFAGRALARLDDATRWQALLPHLHDPRWHEPILLCAGRLGVVENRRPQVSELVRSILTCDDDLETDLHRKLLLALSIASDDVNLDPALLDELVKLATACLPTGITDLDRSLLDHLAQLVANGTVDAERCFGPIWQLEAELVIESLGPLAGNARIRELLLARLDDGEEDLSVRQGAATHLAGQAAGDPAVRAVLLRAARQDKKGRMGDRLSQAALYALIKSEIHDDSVRALVRDWYGRENSELFTELAVALTSWVARDDLVRQELCELLQAGAVPDLRAYLACQALAAAMETDPTVRTTLLQLLEDRALSSKLRAAAALSLSRLAGQDPEVVEALLARVHDADLGLRTATIAGLGAASEQDVIKRALIAAVTDINSEVRTEAVRALAHSWNVTPEVRTAIKAASRDRSPSVRFAAVTVLRGHVDEAEARDLLVAMLDDDDRDVSEGTLTALFEALPAGEHLGALTRTVRSRNSALRRELAAAIGDSANPHRLATLTQVQGDLTDITTIRTTIAPLAFELVNRFPTSPCSHHFIAAALGSRHSDMRALGVGLFARRVREDPEAFSVLAPKIEDPSLDVRLEAVYALADLFSTEASVRKLLVAHLYDSLAGYVDDHWVTAAVMEVLCVEAPADPVLLQILVEYIDVKGTWTFVPEQREALAALAESHAGLYEALLRHSREESSLSVLGEMALGKETRQLLIAIVKAGVNPGARRGNLVVAAVAALARHAATDSLIGDVLVEWLSGGPPNLPQILEGLRQWPISEPRIVEILVSMATDLHLSVNDREEPEDARIRAALSHLVLSKTTGDSSLRALHALARGQDTELRTIALGVLGSTEPDETTRQILIAGLTDPSGRVRTAAASAVAAQAADPETRRSLSQLLGDVDPGPVAAACRALIATDERDAAWRSALSIGMDHLSARVRVATIEGVLAHPQASEWSPALVLRLEEWIGLDTDYAWYHRIKATITPDQFRYRLAAWLAPYLSDNRELSDRLRQQLRDPRASSRLGAGLTLLAWPGGPPAEVVEELWAVLDDWRCLETYSARLKAASYLLNREPYGEAALSLCLEALEYGTRPWEVLGSSVDDRTEAVLALGKLDPLHFVPHVFERLRRTLKDDSSTGVRNSSYQALLRLAQLRPAASHPPASPSSSTVL